MQPYLFPALSYLQLVHAADLFVFYDDARFSHGRWTHRNRVLVGGQPQLFTVPLEGRSPDKALGDIALHPRDFAHWRRKFLATLTQAYARAPNAARVLPRLEAMLAEPRRTLAELAADSVRWLADLCGLETRWGRSSAIDYDRTGSAQDKVLAITAASGGSDYVNTAGGRALYDGAEFRRRGVRLGFLRDRMAGDDTRQLSALHAVLHEPPAELSRLASAYAIDWADAA